jgi:hypothetical protein
MILVMANNIMRIFWISLFSEMFFEGSVVVTMTELNSLS